MLIYSTTPMALAELKPFAEGDHRLCFQHPQQPHLCIKVNRPGLAQALRDRAPWYKKLRSARSFDDNWGEYQIFQHANVVNNTPRVWRHIPRCYGWVETDLGPGLVTDFYTGEAGQPALTLEHHLMTEGLDAPIRRAIDEFKGFLRDTLVLTKNLLPHNFVVINDAAADEVPRLRLVLIDGFGLTGFIPYAKWSKGLNRRYIEQRLKKMAMRIAWEAQGRQTTWEEVEGKPPPKTMQSPPEGEPDRGL